MAINLEESVVIIDEAHNVLRIFEDSSSASFTAKEIALSLSELDFLLDFRCEYFPLFREMLDRKNLEF